jgi:ribonuclease-3
MSRPRFHHCLESVFASKDLLSTLFEHEDFILFSQKYDLNIPLNELVLAFTHKSFSHEYQVHHQEQLEFLGDSVLQLVITSELFKRFPTQPEGHLSKLRSAIVNEKSLSTLARKLCLNELILVGKGEYKKQLFEQDVVLCDTFEALLAQIYRHQGMEFTSSLFLSWLTAFIPDAFEAHFLDSFDAKSKLQERVLAKYKKLPRYTSASVNDAFEITLWINDHEVIKGVFLSKKSGEKELAQQILKSGLI